MMQLHFLKNYTSKVRLIIKVRGLLHHYHQKKIVKLKLNITFHHRNFRLFVAFFYFGKTSLKYKQIKSVKIYAWIKATAISKSNNINKSIKGI